MIEMYFIMPLILYQVSSHPTPTIPVRRSHCYWTDILANVEFDMSMHCILSAHKCPSAAIHSCVENAPGKTFEFTDVQVFHMPMPCKYMCYDFNI